MTNKEKFREVFDLNLCYCGDPDHTGLFYIVDDAGHDIFEDKFDAKMWLNSKYITPITFDIQDLYDTVTKIVPDNRGLLYYKVLEFCNKYGDHSSGDYFKEGEE